MKKIILLLGLFVLNLSIYLDILSMKKQAIIDGRLRDITTYNYFDEDDKIEKSIDIIEDLKESEKHTARKKRKSETEDNKSKYCQKCEKFFSLKKDLKVHIEVVHEKIKKFKCNKCNSCFGYRSSLTNHIKKKHEKHGKINTNICQTCMKNFSCRSNLNRHVKTMHKNKGKLYICKFCDFKFKHRLDYIVHEEYCEILSELSELEEELDN